MDIRQKIDKRFEVTEIRRLNSSTAFIKVRPEDNSSLPEIFPGQFVNIRVEGSDIFLRRPISICYYDSLSHELWLIVKGVGKGSERLVDSKRGDLLKILLPLGNSFHLPQSLYKRVLLIGGGVGVAPLYFLARWFETLGMRPSMLMGARSEQDLLFIDEFKNIGDVYISTDDGSRGEKGLVTMNSILEKEWDGFYVCGPGPMMKAVGKIAKDRGIDCQVSLENHMACGLGACLCCVEDTREGNKCVCTEGPIFNINDLKW